MDQSEAGLWQCQHHVRGDHSVFSGHLACVCLFVAVYRVQLLRSDRSHHARKTFFGPGTNWGMDVLGRIQPHQHRSALRHCRAGGTRARGVV